MTRLELIRAVEQAPAAFPSVLHPVHLKCPGCLIEFDRPQSMAIDAQIKCGGCGVISEFREVHEAWCASRRPILAKALPGMDWQTADYVHSDVCTGGDTRSSIA